MSLDGLKKQFYPLTHDVLGKGRVHEMASFTQHGTTSTLDHTVRVAFRAFAMARGLRLHIDEHSLVRGGILHDYYLYDWHDSNQALDRWHGFTHPGHALRNAEADFPDLTSTERDIISRHMFPFTPIPPRTCEGWLICLADKICSLQEFFDGLDRQQRKGA
ncbi:MAG: HD domain-containing protein [Coriobacteriales bacterium]|nr:HD domain-containing protein [Coriobacteriales bacterium]